MTVTERNPTEIAPCGCPYDPEYDEGSLGWHLMENHPEFYADHLQPGLGLAHSLRFRRVSTRYPHMVTLAFDHNLAWAMASTDDEVAATVADYERTQGWEPRDWQAIGAEERDDS